MKKRLLLILVLFTCTMSTPYIDIVQSVQPSHLIQYLPMNETSGTTAYDSSGNGRNGVYAATCTLNVEGFKDGERAVRFNGINAYVNNNATTLDTAINRSEGSVSFIVKNSQWITTGVKVMFYMYINSSNVIQIALSASVLQFYIVHNGVTENNTVLLTDLLCNRNLVNNESTHFGLTWSKTSNKIRCYLNGARVFQYNIWGNNDFLGALSLSRVGSHNNNYFFKGDISHFAMWNKELTKQEMYTLSDQLQSKSAVCFGNSITAGYTGSVPGALSEQWVTKFSVSSGIKVTRNSGIGNTLLQDSPGASGLIGQSGRERFDTGVVRWEPDYAIILYGTNDIRQCTTSCNLNEFLIDYNYILDSLKKTIVPKNIVIGSIPFINNHGYNTSPLKGCNSPTEHYEYNDSISSMCISKGVTFSDVWAAMATGDTNSIMSSDGIHPNATGHTVIANAFYRAISDFSAEMGIDTLRLVCSAENALTYQWYQNDTVKVGATDSVLVIYADSLFYSKKQVFYCLVNGSVKSGNWVFQARTSRTSRWDSYKLFYKQAYKNTWK